MRFVLPLGSDGWNALVSPDGRSVAMGRRSSIVVTLADLSTRDLVALGASRPMGFFDPTRLCVQEYEDDCRVTVYDLEGNDLPILLAVNQNIQRGSAGLGHWVGGYAADRRVVRDGALLDVGVDWHCGGEGQWAVILSESQLHVYRNGTFWRTVSHAIVRDYAIVRGDYCGIGRNGPPQLVYLPLGETRDVTVTPWRKECEPVYSEGWVCTVTELPAPQALVRPYGALDVIALPVPEGAVGCDFRVVGTRGIVATWSDHGQCVIQDCDLNAPRKIMEPLVPIPPIEPTLYLHDVRAPNPIGPAYAQPVDPDPVIPPIGTMWMGMFKVAGHANLNADDWVKHASDGEGLWLRAPGNCVVVTGEAAAAATACSGWVPRPSVVISPDAIPFLAQNGGWDRCAAIWCGGEASADPTRDVARQRRLASYEMDEWVLSPRPCILYSDTNSVEPSFLALMNDPAPSWLGLRIYVDPGQGPERVYELAAQYRTLVPRGMPVAWHMMAYDRNGAYRAPLTPIVLASADVVREWEADDPGSCKALLFFSDGRGHLPTAADPRSYGGARFHPELYVVLRSVAAAIRRPL